MSNKSEISYFLHHLLLKNRPQHISQALLNYPKTSQDLLIYQRITKICSAASVCATKNVSVSKSYPKGAILGCNCCPQEWATKHCARLLAVLPCAPWVPKRFQGLPREPLGGGACVSHRVLLICLVMCARLVSPLLSLLLRGVWNLFVMVLFKTVLPKKLRELHMFLTQ